MNIFDRTREEEYVRMQDIDWQEYNQLLHDPEVGHLRLTYDRGILELQSRSFAHERAHITLKLVVNALMEILNVNMTGAGSTTLRRQDLECGLEPDESYYIEHWQSFMRLIREKRELKLPDDPPPDLIIEVDNPTTTLDRMGIYARLRVQEVWRRTRDRLRIYTLQPQGFYRECNHSPAFPIITPSEVMAVLVQHEHEDDTALLRSLRRWVRERTPSDQWSHTDNT